MRENHEDIVIDRNDIKRPSGNGKLQGIIGISVIALILIMAAAALIAHLTGMSLTDFEVNEKAGSVIYDSLPDSIENIEKYSSGVVMVTDTAVDYLDSEGNHLSSNPHTFSQPCVDIKNTTLILYDKGGLSFRIEKGTAVYDTFTVSKPIVTASIGNNRNYAYVLNDDGGYQSHLYVYNLQGNKLFEWGSSADYCIETALSDNGRSIAVALLGVKNGEYVSKINFFNFRDDKALYSIELPDCTVFGLEFINSKTVAALTDNGIFVINKNGEYEKTAEYSPVEILHSSSSFRGLKSVATALHGNLKATQVSVYNKKFEELYKLDFNSEVYSVRTSDKYTAVIQNGLISVYNNKGEMTGSVISDERVEDAAFSGNSLYALTVSGIYCFDVNSTYDKTAVSEESTTDISAEATETTTGQSDIITYG